MAVKGWPADKQAETMKLMELMRRRARGELKTGARFLRDFVMEHPAYKQDSKISQEISHDLIKMLETINEPGDAGRTALFQGAY